MIPSVNLEGDWTFAGDVVDIQGCRGTSGHADVSVSITQVGTSLSAVVSGYGNELSYEGEITNWGFELERSYTTRRAGKSCRTHASFQVLGYGDEVPAVVSTFSRCRGGTICGGTFVGTLSRDAAEFGAADRAGGSGAPRTAETLGANAQSRLLGLR